MIKLYPLHWILLPLGFYITRDVFLQTVKYLPANFLLCQSLIPDQFCYYSGNGVSWFLSTIVFLYIVFPLLWRICSRLAIRWNIALYALLIIIRYSLEIELPEDIKTDWLYINPLTRWMDFTCGIITYLLYKKLKDVDVIIKNKSLLIAFGLFIVTFPITVFIITHNRTYSLVIFWIAYSLLIGGSSLLEMCWERCKKASHPKLMRIISSFSSIMFSFYLLHQIVILVLYNHPPINLLDNKFMKFLLILGICVLLAFIFHNYFEKPAAAYMKKIWKNNKK